MDLKNALITIFRETDKKQTRKREKQSKKKRRRKNKRKKKKQSNEEKNENKKNACNAKTPQKEPQAKRFFEKKSVRKARAAQSGPVN